MATNTYYEHYFVLDSGFSNAFGVGISGSGRYKSAERDLETEHIFGRNGDLLTDNGAFLNRVITYPCWIAHTFKTDFPRFRNFLMAHTDKYYRLIDSYDSVHFCMARVVGPIDPEVLVMRRAGKFDVTFDCKPQLFRFDGADEITLSAGTLTNPTDFPCTPLIKVVGAGQVTINGQTITVGSGCSSNTVYVDCETMDAYSIVNGERVNENYNVTLPIKQITLQPGANTVALSGVTAGITPNWYDM